MLRRALALSTTVLRHPAGLAIIAIICIMTAFVLLRADKPAVPNHPAAAVNSPVRAAALPSPSINFSVAPAGTNSPVDGDLARFSDWLRRFNAGSQNASVPEGIQLATVRRAAMKVLIQSDPERALGLSIPAPDRDRLPASIDGLLEQEIHATGNFNVMCVTPLRGHESEMEIARTVTIKDQTFNAHVYGHLAQMPTLQNVALEGVALDHDMAIADIPPSRIRAFGDSSVGSSDVTGRPISSWTTVPKKVLIIRVDFPDLQGEPVYIYNTNTVISTNYVANLFNQSNGIAGFFRQNSYGKTDLILGPADVTPVYRMPSNAVWYAAGDSNRFFGAEMQAVAYADAAADYDLSQYDIIALVHSTLAFLPHSLMTFAGQGSIGGKYIFINGAFDFSVVAHEIGHTYGVFHANRWKPTDGTIIGPESDMARNLYNGALSVVSIEYGDGSDVMGIPEGSGGQYNASHLNHWFKNILNWMPDSAVQTVTTSGVYRVYRADTGNADLANHKLALKVCRDMIRDYWVGYRRLQTNGVNLANGATIEFGYNENRAAELLVCNGPLSTWTNAALTVGQSLTDTNDGVNFTTLAQGGVEPDEYQDVQVAMLPRVSFSSNLVLGLTWEGQATVVVDRLGGSTGTTTVQYLCLNSNAVAGVHYTPISGTLTWGPGDTSSRTLTIPILPYSATNSQRDLIVRLTNIVNGVVINPGDCVVSLRHPGNAGITYHPAAMGAAVLSIAPQPDGKWIIGGSFTGFGEGVGTDNTAKYIARLLPNGHRDYTFKSVPGASRDVQVVRVQPDGKILLGGYFTNYDGISRMYLARALPDGGIDTNFIPPSFDGAVYEIEVQPDGKVLVGGSFTTITNNGVPLTTAHGVRLKPDGSLDTVFARGAGFFSSFQIGKFALDNYTHSNPNDWIFYSACADSRFADRKGLTRRFGSGIQDTNFNIGLGANNALRVVTIQPDGKFLVGGDFTTFDGAPHTHIARLNANGSVDTNFNTSIDGNYVFSILVQPDGKILIGGWFNNVNGLANTNLARLNADGTVDQTWDNGVGAYNGCGSVVNSMELMPDGRVMVTSEGGRIRNAFSAPFYTYATTTQPLYTGITNLTGVTTIASPAYPAAPGLVVNVPVQRTGGASGMVQLDYSTQNGTALAGTDFTAAQGTLTWADGDTTTRMIAVNCNPAAIAGRSFTVNLGIPRTTFLGTVQQANVTVATNLTYDAWRALKFNPSQQTNDNISGLTASPAGDGVQNLLKYALDLDPFTPATTNLPSATFNGNRLQMKFRRDPLRPDLTYEVIASDDLPTSTVIARSANGRTTTNLNAFAVSESQTNLALDVTVDDAATLPTTPHRFMELKVSRP